MQSIIFGYLDKKGEECISIGSKGYYDNLIGSMSQQIYYCMLDHEQKDWDYMRGLSEDELYFALNQYIKNNNTKVIYLQ